MDKSFIKFLLKKSKRRGFSKISLKRKLIKCEKFLNEINMSLADFPTYEKLYKQFIRNQKIKTIKKIYE